MEKDSVIVAAQLPRTLVNWMDKLLAERRLASLNADNQEALIPTRSSFIRDLVNKAKNGK